MASSGLGNLLVREGLLTESDRRTIADTAGRGSSAFAKGVLALGLLDEEELATFIANRTRFPLAARDLADDQQQGASAILAPQLLQFLEIVPLKVDDQTVTIAMVDPLDRETTHQVEFFAGRRVRPVIATFSQICEGLKKIIPEFAPTNSPLEEFLANHAEAAGRKIGIFSGGAALGAAAASSQGFDSSSGQSAGASAAAGGVEEDSGSSQGSAGDSSAMDDQALRAADTISRDAREVEQGADPFAKIDTEEPPLPDPALSAADGAPSEAVAESSAVDGGELSASTADEGLVEEASESTEAVDAAQGGSGAGSSSGRAMAEAGHQEEAALAQELGLDAAETAGDISVIGEPTEASAGLDTSVDLEAGGDGGEVLTGGEPALEVDAGDIAMEVTPPSESAPIAEPVTESAELVVETADVATEVADVAADQAGDPGIALAGESTAGPGVEAICEDSAATMTDEPNVDPSSVVATPTDLGKPDSLDPSVRVAAINRALLGVQLASTNEKAFEAGAKGLGKASCSPGILFGSAKDSGKVIMQWSGVGEGVKANSALLGQLDTADLEAIAAQSPESVISPLSGAHSFLGLQLPAGRGYIVSMNGANGSKFIAAFEAEDTFASASGLHASVVELLRRISAKLH